MKKVLALMVAAAFVLTMYVPASAENPDWDLYGSARVNTFWTDYDDEYGGADGDPDTTQLDHDLQSNARIGATVDHGAIGGGFEYGASGKTANVRKLYGTVDMGQGQLKIGQDYSPFGAGSFISAQAYGDDNNMLQFVGYTGRNPMVQYSVDGFKIALVTPEAYEYEDDTGEYEGVFDEEGNLEDEEEIVEDTDYDPEVVLPQIQASYDLALQDGFDMNLAGVYQTYKLDKGDGETLTSWAMATNFKFTQMDPMYVNLGGFYGENVGNYGQYDFYTADRPGAALVDDPDEDIEDTETYGALLVVGADLNNFGLEAGVGYRESDNDEWDNEQETIGYYGQATVPLTENGNAFIVPEVGYMDYNDKHDGDDDDMGDELYAGLKWQVNF